MTDGTTQGSVSLTAREYEAATVTTTQDIDSAQEVVNRIQYLLGILGTTTAEPDILSKAYNDVFGKLGVE